MATVAERRVANLRARRAQEARDMEVARQAAQRLRASIDAQMLGAHMASGINTPAEQPLAASGVFHASSESPALCTSQYRGGLAIVLVGAGGTGARIMPPLMQMLRQGDRVAIVDHDIVEDRNLMRQHFVSRDIGQHKASVLAQRYNKPGRVETHAFTGALSVENAPAYMGEMLTAIGLTSRVARQQIGTVFIGAVDNAAARKAINEAAEYCASQYGGPVGWIDVGNETRGGQVIMSLRNWLTRVRADGKDADGQWQVDGMAAMPQLLQAPAEDTESCGTRIDLQTVQVNHLSAACALNCLSWLMLGIPYTNVGAFFSTLNSMQPIPVAKVNWTRKILTPTEQFAS